MQEQDSFRLVVRRGPQPNQIYEIVKEVTTLGRDITNDIVINDREASRHHLRLVRSGGNITIEDLGSTNGTFVNGKRLSGMTPLQNGDMVGLGETVTLGFEAHRAQSGQSSPSPSPSSPPQQPPVVSQPPPQAEIPASNPYAPPQPASQGYPQQQQQPPDPYAPPSDPYQQPQQQGYQAYSEQPQSQQADYYGQQQASYGTPAPPQQYPGYDYDPYAIREEEGGSSTRWLILGCVVFFFLACACFTIIALVMIDAANLWCDAPIISQIVRALGYCGL
jgi:hypothetical protein